MCDQSITIPLTQGKAVIVDAADYPLVSQYHWHAKAGYATCYAVTNVKGADGTRRALMMHRLIMSDPPGKDIHHIDGDGLNNRRANLEVLTRGENNRNHRRTFGRGPVEWTPRERDEQTITRTGDGRALVSLVGEAGRGKYAVIDADDVTLVQGYRWNVFPTGRTAYAIAYERATQRQVFMHRLIFGAKDGEEVDHRDHDGLNNTRANLRPASSGQQKQNRRKTAAETSSRFKGVTRKPHGWEAAVNRKEGYLYLGSFETEEAAARAYDSAAHHLYGDFALLNFPNETPAPYVTPNTLTRSGSGYRGVQEDKRTGRYRAVIYDGTRNRNLGFYATAEEAAIAYDDTAYTLRGDAAQLNFPDRPHGASQIDRPKAAAGKPSTTGERFITQRGSGYRVVIYRGRARVNVGQFATIEEAIKARDEALAE